MAAKRRTSARKGKVACLPFEIREQLNQRLLDGQRAPQILAWVNALPDATAVMQERFRSEPITPQNLSEWRNGGYQDWLDDREEVNRVRTSTEIAQRLLSAAGGSITGPAAAILGGKLLRVIETAADAEAAELVSSLASLQSAEAAAVRARTDQDRLAVQKRSVTLEEQKFRRQTVELFLKWHADQRLADIAGSDVPADEKTNRLGQAIFGEDWQ